MLSWANTVSIRQCVVHRMGFFAKCSMDAGVELTEASACYGTVNQR